MISVEPLQQIWLPCEFFVATLISEWQLNEWLYFVIYMHCTDNQMHHTDKKSQYSSIILPVWLNAWVFVYEVNGCGFESHCCYLNFRYSTSFEQGVPWHSGKLQSVDLL